MTVEIEKLNLLNAIFGVQLDDADCLVVKPLAELLASAEPLERVEYSTCDVDYYEGAAQAFALTKEGEIIALNIAVIHKDARGYELRASALPVNRQLLGRQVVAVLIVSPYYWGNEKVITVYLYVGVADCKDFVKQAIMSASAALIQEIEKT